MRDTRIEAKVGALVVVCLLILVTFFFLLGDIRFGDSSLVDVDFRTSAGLKPGANVQVVGMRAGRVEEVTYRGGEVDQKTGRPTWVRVVISVDPEVRETLRKDTKAFITTVGLLGEKYVEIDPGVEDAPFPEGEVLVGTEPMRMEVMAENVNKTLGSVQRLLEENEERIGQTLEDVAAAARSGRAALEEGRALVSDARESLKRVESKGFGLVDSAEAALAEFTPGKGATGNDIRAVTKHAAHLVGTLDATVGDGRAISGALSDVRALAQNARKVVDQVGGKAVRVATKVEGLVDSADVVVKDGSQSVLATLDKAQAVADSLQRVLALLEDGRGTVGAMLNDREMFDDARELMKDLKRHPWKFLWKE